MKKQKTKEAYELRRGILESLLSNTLTAKEIKEISGLSYRQINDWDKKGILPAQERESSNAWQWRRFTGSNTIQLSVLAKLRKTGLPVIDLKELHKWMKDGESSTSEYIKEQIAHGHTVFLSTNLKDRFFFNSDGEKDISEMMLLAYNEHGGMGIVLQISINDIVNDILKTLNQKPLK